MQAQTYKHKHTGMHLEFTDILTYTHSTDGPRHIDRYSQTDTDSRKRYKQTKMFTDGHRLTFEQTKTAQRERKKEKKRAKREKKEEREKKEKKTPPQACNESSMSSFTVMRVGIL